MPAGFVNPTSRSTTTEPHPAWSAELLKGSSHNGVPRTHDYEGGTAGSAIATTDTGNGDQWTQVLKGADGIVEYATGPTSGGTVGRYATRTTAGNAQTRWQRALPEDYGRLYFEMDGAGSFTADSPLIGWRTSADSFAARIVWRASDGRLIPNNSAFAGTGANGTVALTPGTRYRLEWHFIPGPTGFMEWRVYLGHSLSVLDSGIAAGQSFGADIGYTHVGLSTTTADTPSATQSLYIDDVVSGGTDWPGPSSTGPASFSSSASETLVLADAITRTTTGTRGPSDSFVLSDAATRTVAGPRAPSESLVLADAVTRTTTRARAPSESLVLADAVTRVRGGARGPTDSFVLADAISLGGGIARSAADSLVLSDTTSRSARTGSRAPAESLVLADTVTRTLHRGSTVTEALVLSDTATRTGARPRTAGESLVLSDAFSTITTDVLRVFSPSRAFTPQMVFGNPTAPVSTSRSVSEALVLSDLGTPSGAHRNRGATDSFSLADAASATGADVLRIFDPSRAFTARMVFGTPIANPSAVDTFFLSDAAERSGSVRARTPVEALGLNDVVTRATHQPRVISESLALSDAIVTVFRGRSVQETLRLADLVVRTTSRTRARTDAFTLADSVFWSGGTKLRTLSESLVLFEAETRHLSASRILEDDLVLSDVYSTPPVYRIFKGTVPVSRIYLGTTPVLAIYRGTTRVF